MTFYQFPTGISNHFHFRDMLSSNLASFKPSRTCPGFKLRKLAKCENGLAKTYLKLSHFFWTVFILDLVIQLNCGYSDGCQLCSPCSQFIFVL